MTLVIFQTFEVALSLGQEDLHDQMYEKRLLSLPFAIRSMTVLAATFFGIPGRGSRSGLPVARPYSLPTSLRASGVGLSGLEVLRPQ